MSNDNNIPAIRTFQMDASTVGNLRSSINLFRGDINYNETLFTMPGKGDNDGLEVKVALQYQSNVNQSVTTWNRDTPTGIVGLGWSLSNSVITLNDNGAVTPGAESYTFQANGINSKMVREPQNPILFEISGSKASSLKDGDPIPEDIRTCFVNSGLAVSGQAIVTQTDAGWTINDDILQQQFCIVPTDSHLTVHDGGESYQLINYNFWKFIYYARYERWSVITDSGTKLSFGGIAEATNHGYRTSIGNSIEWGVLWTDSSNKPVWKGNSAITKGQQQYARAWNMSRAYNIWGDAICYGYNEWARNDNGLIPIVEQQVGNSGLPYTKASYLTSITDAFGRKAAFEYTDKLWSDKNKTDAREYCDPHKAVPDNTPNGFQDCYETFYLSGVHVDDHSGNALFSIKFTYSVSNLIENNGDFAKRLLTGFQMSNGHGATQPGFRFDYNIDAQSDDAHLGALKTITYPTGGKAEYQYTPLSLTTCNRSLTVKPPSPMTEGSPRVWFGSDYAVTNWYNEGTGQLSLQIHTWTGQWITWQPANDSALISSKGIDLNSLEVLTGDDFVAISFKTSNSVDVYLYRKDPARQAQWVAADIQGGGSGGEDAPTLTYSLDDGEAQIQAGQQFVFISQMNTTQNKGLYDRITWNWTTNSWTKERFTVDSYTLFTVKDEYYASIDLKGTLALDYLDATMTWQNSTPITLTGFPITDSNAFAIRSSTGMVAVSNRTSYNQQMQTYEVSLVQWDDQYTLASPSVHNYSDQLDRQHPTTWVPTIVSNTLVAIAGHLIRFNGQAWLENNSLMPTVINNDWQQRYAYGPDCATLVYVAPNGNPTASLLAYNADNSSNTWDSTPTEISNLTIPPDHVENANWPSTGGGNDYLVVGSQLFFRGSSSDWSDRVSSSIADIQSSINSGGGDQYQLNSESMINEGPQFLACSVYDNNTATETQATVLVLKNGNIYQSAQVIDGEAIWTSDGMSSPAGKSPGGPNAFASYPDTFSRFDQATHFSLNHYAGDAIKGDIIHYAVTGLMIHDGLMENSNTVFEPDYVTAGCDTTGRVIKYFKNTVYPGSNASDKTYGSVENHYLNGVEIITGNDYYNMLDGMLHSVVTKDKDDKTLSVQTNEYTAYVQRAGHPTDGSIPARNLKGAYVLQTRQSTQEDGLECVSAIDYVPSGLPAPYTGQPASKSSPTWSGSGKKETLSAEFRYACEVNNSANILNNLSGVVEQVSYSTQENATKVKTSASATALAAWPSNWPDGAMVPAEEADFGWLTATTAFPFNTYQQGDNPEGWQVTNRILTRLEDGSAIEREDGGGTPQATLYSKSLALPVAIFSGARLTECAYYGFEDYENADMWQKNNLTYNTDDTHTGTRSGCLRQDAGATLAATVTPQASRKALVIGFWYKTAAGYSASGSGWHVAGNSVDQTVAFEDTNGQWRYKTAGIQLSPNGGDVTVTASNKGSTDVLLDNIVLIPLGAELAASVWHPQRRLLSAAMDQTGQTTLTRYNLFDHTVGSVGPDGHLQELSQSFFSRQGSQDDQFEETSPNAELTLHAAETGKLETFLDGGQWRNRWQPASDNLWHTDNGALNFTGDTANTLTWTGQNGNISSAAYYVEVLPKSDPKTALGINFANGCKIRWETDKSPSWSWTDKDGNVVQTPLSTPPKLAGQWLLLVSDNGMVQFYGDGQLLFCHNLSSLSDPGQYAIETGGNAMTLRNLSTAQAPRLGISYNDGGSRSRQTHQLHNTGSLAMEMIYDPLDRQIAVTRIAPIEFNNKSNITPMAYSSAFVDVKAFLASLATTWKMSGYVADYYNDQDQGYPYSGIRYEASSRNRQLENGDPGLENAIHDVNTTTPEQRHTIKTSYGVSVEGDPLPAGDYFARETTTGQGYAGRRLIDSSGRMVSNIQYDTDGNTVGYSGAFLDSSEEGNAYTQSTLKLPNAYTSSPQSDPDKYTRVQKQNPLAQVNEMQDADSGTIKYIHDGKGNLRFTQPAMDPGEQYYLYSRYDALGRIVEEGYVSSSWDESQLTGIANDQTRPDNSDGAIACRTYTYDGDGNKANALGKLIKVITNNPSPDGEHNDCTVIEEWQYDVSGRVFHASLTTSGLIEQTVEVQYTYNNINELLSVEFPENDMPLSQILYTLDDQGRIIAISTSTSTVGDIAAYTYNADGSINTETLGPNLPASFSYDSKGQLLNYNFTVNGKNVFEITNRYNYDGVVTGRSRVYAFNEYSDQCYTTYQYDGQQRFTAAEVEGGKHGGETVSLYDANGNIWQGSQNGNNFQMEITPGTNQLQGATLASGSSVTFSYQKDGRPDNWRGTVITYDNGTGSMTLADTGSKKVRFCYGINNHQVVRSTEGDTRIKFYGAGNMPLITFINGRPTLSIWGPTGLAALHDGNLALPLKDTQHTVWAWVDVNGGLLAYYDFLPYGTVNNKGGNGVDILPIQFMGKEYDTDLKWYDFGTRAYDPALMRFLAPDPARQYASPYVFVGNCPLSFTDPSGNISIWAQVGIAVAMVAITAVGLILTPVTGGASDALAAGADASLAGAAVASDVAIEMTEIGAEAAVEASVEAGAEAGAEVAAEEVATGVSVGVESGEATASATAGSSIASNISYVAQSAGLSALSGAGMSGLTYDVTHGRDFTAKGFFTAMGIGAASGAISGGLGSLATMPASAAATASMSITRQILTQMVAKGAASMIGSDIKTILTDVASGQKITFGQMLQSSATGFASGVASGTFSAVKGIRPGTAAVSSAERAAVKASTVINKVIDKAKSAATSQTAYAYYMVGGFNLVGAYAAWGTYEASKS